MSSPYLTVFRSNARQEALDLLPRLLGDGVKSKDVLAFCEHCRVHGIAGLLLEGIPFPLQKELRRSGHAMLHALPRLSNEDRATGKLVPLFDVIAADDWNCARSLARLARPSWNPEEEYEEDFLFAFWVIQRFLLDAPDHTSRALIERWTTLLQGSPDCRLGVVSALQDGDVAGFDSAFEEYLLQEKLRLQRLTKAGALAPEIEATTGYVSVEAIAIVRLAQRLGFSTSSDYWSVPSVAIADVPGTQFEAPWQDI